MKTLPILTCSALAVIGTLYVDIGQSLTSFLQADDRTQASVETAPQTGDGQLDQTEPADSTTETASSKRATELVQQARMRLYEYDSVQAKIRETVSIGDHKFRAAGTYIAGGFPKLRLEFAMEVGDTQARVLEVCDGQLLWAVQQVVSEGGEPEDISITRTVIDEIVDALGASGNLPEAQLVQGLGLGGLPALLAALERSMTFDALRETESDGHRFTIVQGKWDREFLARLGAEDEDPELPAYIPDRVRLYIEQETLFPMRVLYLKRTSPERRTYRPMLSLEFTDVALDEAVDDGQFLYVPSDQTKVRNRTSEYLRMIDAIRQQAESDGDATAQGAETP